MTRAGDLILPDEYRPGSSTLLNMGKIGVKWTDDSGPLAGDTFQKYQPTEASSHAWIVGSYDFANANGTRHNHVWTMGWNLAPSPAQNVAGQPAWGIGFEQHYQPDGSNNYFEHHLYYVRADGTQRRPISWSANKATHYIDGYIEANRFSWYSQAGAAQPTFSIDTDVNTVKVGGSLYFAVLPITDKSGGGAIGTAAATVDIYSSFDVSQSTAGQTLTLPTPTDQALRREVSVSSVGSQAFTMLGTSVTVGASIRAKWTGAAWSKFI